MIAGGRPRFFERNHQERVVTLQLVGDHEQITIGKPNTNKEAAASKTWARALQ